MLFYFAVTTLLLTCNTVAFTTVSKLEMCLGNLQRQVDDLQQILDDLDNLIRAMENTNRKKAETSSTLTIPTTQTTPTIPTTLSTTQTTLTISMTPSTTQTTPKIPMFPSNCADLLKMGNTKSDIYTIYPKSWAWNSKKDLSVYCDMETDGGGWIVFQRRADYLPRENFTQTWEAYRRGFGQLDREFWLGNENIFFLTQQEKVTLRVDLEDFDGETRYATYDNSNVSNYEDKYRLHLGNYNGNAGDSLKFNGNKQFTTWDIDNSRECNNRINGGWWYNSCYRSSLNGEYKIGYSNYPHLVSWVDFRGATYSLKKSEMKIRPSDFKKLT